MNLDLILVTGYMLAAILAVVEYDIGFAVATLLFFAVPGAYLSWRRPKIISKTVFFSLLIGVPFGLMIDYLAHRDLAWYIPGSGFRLFDGQVAIESVIWSVLWVYAVVAFWEVFAERGTEIKNRVSPRVKYLLGMTAGLFTVFLAMYMWAREALMIPYLYLVVGVIMELPAIIMVLGRHRKLAVKALFVGVYFAVISLAIEFAALTVGHWFFPGSRYLWVGDFFGHRLPVEELVFWCVFGAPGVIAWYEFFADDLK